MTTVLVANRGEIVLRVFATARRLGLRCVAVYSDADADAPWVRQADEAVRLGPAPAADSYLRIDALMEAARTTGADLLHPGYGFLSEDPRLARACEEAGVTFVGPSADVLERVGSKASARSIAEAAGVPLLAGATLEGDEQDVADAVGYPLIVKPAAGGGGKGMAVVEVPEGLAVAVASARRLGEQAFGDDAVVVERYLADPRHIEVQVLGDRHGNVVHLGARDCSVQRRHQKVVEEAPPAHVDAAVVDELCEAAVRFASSVGYSGAGTCEFLVDGDGASGFIEMNARLQVEHPVTEAVTGIDLVEAQLRVAQGEVVDLAPRIDGHAIEARIYAESPADGFLPQAGEVLHVAWPRGARIDAGVEAGSVVTTDYDPMLAKLIVHADHRADAVDALARALDDTVLLGLPTNLPYLRQVVATEDFRAGRVSTTWLDGLVPSSDTPDSHLWSAAVGFVAAERPSGPDPWTALRGWRAAGRTQTTVTLRWEAEERTVAATDAGAATMVAEAGTVHVQDAGHQATFLVGPAPRSVDAGGSEHLVAPLPGQVVSVAVETGQRVSKGDALVVVEAMKMEHTVSAHVDGVVTAVRCVTGDQVDRGQVLVDVEAG